MIALEIHLPWRGRCTDPQADLRHHGLSETIRLDQGSEFVSRGLDLWAYAQGVALDFSRPRKPTESAFIEGFNDRFGPERPLVHITKAVNIFAHGLTACQPSLPARWHGHTRIGLAHPFQVCRVQLTPEWRLFQQSLSRFVLYLAFIEIGDEVMSERRDLLKLASAIPLSLLATSALAQSGESPDTATATSTAGQPAAPRVQEPAIPKPDMHDYPNYHLLGRPDADGNLLGAHRPTDWRTTKTALRTALHEVVDAHDPIHDWLATFSTSFDERATSIVVGAKPALYAPPGSTTLRYEPQLYDATLRGAAALLDRCLRYRNDMGQFEISGVTAGLSYLTFVKTKPLQRNYLENSNNAVLAKLEHDTDTQAADELAKIWGLLRLFDSHQLRARQIELAGSAGGESLEAKKYDLLTQILRRQFNIQSDAQLAQFTRMITSGSASNFAERYLRLLAMLVEDLTDAYAKLFSAAIGVQTVVGLTQVAIGQGPSIAVAIPAFSTAADIQTWVNAVVPQPAGAQRNPDVLDAMVLWCRAVMRTLDTQAQFESEFTVSIPLNQAWGNPPSVLVTQAQLAAALASNNALSFTLPNGALPIAGTLRFPRLSGVGLTVEYTDDDQSPLQYTTGFPASGQPSQVTAAKAFEQNKQGRLNATLTSPPQALAGGGSYSRPKLFVPNVRIQGGSGGDYEPTLTYDLGCRGLNPLGAWTITFDRNVLEFFQSASAVAPTKVTGIVLHLRLRGVLS